MLATSPAAEDPKIRLAAIYQIQLGLSAKSQAGHSMDALVHAQLSVREEWQCGGVAVSHRTGRLVHFRGWAVFYVSKIYSLKSGELVEGIYLAA
jgi:hypothetical protein